MTKSPHPSSVDKGELLPVTVEDKGLVPFIWAMVEDGEIERAEQAAARHRLSSAKGVISSDTLHSLPGDVGTLAWRTIDSAPTDGETILAICASAYTPTAFDTWWQDGWTHYSRPDDKWHGGVGKWFPTHWMPRELYLAALAPSVPSDTVVFAAIKRGGAVHTGRSSHADIEADIGSEDGDVLGYLMSVGGRFVAADDMDIEADMALTPSALSGDVGEGE